MPHLLLTAYPLTVPIGLTKPLAKRHSVVAGSVEVRDAITQLIPLPQVKCASFRVVGQRRGFGKNHAAAVRADFGFGGNMQSMPNTITTHRRVNRDPVQIPNTLGRWHLAKT